MGACTSLVGLSASAQCGQCAHCVDCRWYGNASPQPAAVHDESLLKRTIFVKGATRTQLQHCTALRTALAVCGNISQVLGASDGVLVEYEDPDKRSAWACEGGGATLGEDSTDSRTACTLVPPMPKLLTPP